MKFYLNNKSVNLSESDFNILLESLKVYLNDFSLDWSTLQIEIESSENSLDSTLPNTIIIFDSIDDEQSLSYNFEQDKNSIARIFVKTILESGGNIFYGNDSSTSVSQEISSVILGLVSNFDMNKWYMDQNKVFWWGDVSSPVYGNTITINSIDGRQIGFADYVLPAYFGTSGKEGPFNKNNTLMGPFGLDEFGYSIKFENNNFVPTFGSSCHQEIIDKLNVYVDEFRSRFTNL